MPWSLAVHQFASHGELAAARWEPFTTWPIWRYLLNGLWATLRGRRRDRRAERRARAVAGARPAVDAPTRCAGSAGAYVEIFRTVPALLLIYVTLFALPQYGLNLPLFWKLVVPLVVSNSAAFAEIFRAGILAAGPRADRGRPRGRAAPRAGDGAGGAAAGAAPIAPSLVSQLVGLLKDTSLGFVVSYTELLYSGQVLASYTHLLIQTFLVVALIYLVVNALAVEVRPRTPGPQRPLRRPARTADRRAAPATPRREHPPVTIFRYAELAGSCATASSRAGTTAASWCSPRTARSPSPPAYPTSRCCPAPPSSRCRRWPAGSRRATS